MNLWRFIPSGLAFVVFISSASGQQRNLTITVQGYEVSRATATELLAPAQLPVTDIVRKLVAMSREAKTAKIATFVNASGASGTQIQGATQGGTFRAEPLETPDGSLVDVNISLKTTTAGISTAGTVPVGRFLLLGILEGSTDDHVTLVFLHAGRS